MLHKLRSHPLQGGLKARRLSQLVSSLRGKSVRRGLDEGIRLVGLKELRIGRNMGVAVALKVSEEEAFKQSLARRRQLALASVGRVLARGFVSCVP